MFHWQSCPIVDLTFGLIKYLSFNGYIIHNYKYQLGVAIIKCQGPGMQLVMHMRCGGRGSSWS